MRIKPVAVTERLLFLDFDGVLHPNHCPEADYFRRAPLLSRWLAAAGEELGIVISSSWRHHHAADELLARLPAWLAARVVGFTGPAVIGRHARHGEITRFLADHPGWTSWRALDDSGWEFPSPCPELILCRGGIGLTATEIARLHAWLEPSLERSETTC